MMKKELRYFRSELPNGDTVSLFLPDASQMNIVMGIPEFKNCQLLKYIGGVATYQTEKSGVKVFFQYREKAGQFYFVQAYLEDEPTPESSLTHQEARIVQMFGDAWNESQELPEEHSMERQELCAAVHICQRTILARAGRRQFKKMCAK